MKEATVVSNSVKTAPEETKAVVSTNGHGHGTSIAKVDSTKIERFLPVDMNVEASELPDLNGAKEMGVDLMSSYWTPETPGETKNLFFDEVRDSEMIDEETGQIKILRTAFFYEKVSATEIKPIRNASKRLVGAVDGVISRGTPIRVTYLGKKKNINNAFKSDDWSVKPLLIPVKG